MNAIADIMKYETAGDPVSGCKWTRKSTGKIARQLNCMGIGVSANTVGRLLKKMDYSLRRNLKILLRPASAINSFVTSAPGSSTTRPMACR